MSVLRQNEPHEQIETIANHGPLCKRIKTDKKKSSNQPYGRDSENLIGEFLKSFSILVELWGAQPETSIRHQLAGEHFMSEMALGVGLKYT